MTNEEYKKLETGDFLNLKSDADLRTKVENLTFENPHDKTAVGLILEKPVLSKFQRQWFKTLIGRKGKAFKS